MIDAKATSLAEHSGVGADINFGQIREVFFAEIEVLKTALHI